MATQCQRMKLQDRFNLGGMYMKPILNFENYAITLDGRIINNTTKKCKKPTDNHSGNGYLYVDLYKDGKRHRKYVHRLVAETYIPNPLNLPFVNHIDGNPKNNNYKNLEWCTEKYNTNYGNVRVKQAKAVSKAVVCIETGEVFCSQKEAGQIMKVAYQHICDCCKGKKQTCGGYHWRYANCEEAEKALERSKGNA